MVMPFPSEDIFLAKNLIDKARRITLLTHTNPDGDGISACAALAYIFEQQGKKVETVYPTKTDEDIKRQPANIFISRHEQIPDLIIATDTSVYERLYFPDVFNSIPMIVIDHHLNNKLKGVANFVSINVSSTCELLYYLINKWYPQSLDKYVAECLLYGILYDTQVFYNQATHAETLRVSGQLIDLGVDLCQLQQELLCNKNPAVISFWGHILSSVVISSNNIGAWVVVRQKDLVSRGLTLSATVGLSNFLAQLSTVDITVLFYESSDGKTKISLRSKQRDVCSIAGKFGGGGHKNASGITTDKSVDVMINEIANIIESLS